MTAIDPVVMTTPAVVALTALLERHTGQQITSYRSWRLDVALKPLMRERAVTTLDQLVRDLRDGGDQQLGSRIVDALLNQETSFFRDAGILEQSVEAIGALPRGPRRPRIWSAGCSTGQEPLSLAMLFHDHHVETGAAMPEIVASDVSDHALARARAGRFTQFEIQRGLPIRRTMRWFDGTVDGDWVAHPDLVRMIAWRQINLALDPSPPGTFDMILCRNVLLYFGPDLKMQTLARFARALRPGGFLVLGAGETVVGSVRGFSPSARFRGYYERDAAA